MTHAAATDFAALTDSALQALVDDVDGDFLCSVMAVAELAARYPSPATAPVSAPKMIRCKFCRGSGCALKSARGIGLVRGVCVECNGNGAY
jgi:hypothetical protein